jgi:hypothetical protein
MIHIITKINKMNTSMVEYKEFCDMCYLHADEEADALFDTITEYYKTHHVSFLREDWQREQWFRRFKSCVGLCFGYIKENSVFYKECGDWYLEAYRNTPRRPNDPVYTATANDGRISIALGYLPSTEDDASVEVNKQWFGKTVYTTREDEIHPLGQIVKMKTTSGGYIAHVYMKKQ